MVAETIQKISGPRFKLGTMVVAQEALATIEELAEKKHPGTDKYSLRNRKCCVQEIAVSLYRKHIKLEQGELCQDDWNLNLEAVNRVDSEGKPDPKGNLRERIFSAFKIEEVKFWVITEWDESSTCILLPDEY